MQKGEVNFTRIGTELYFIIRFLKGFENILTHSFYHSPSYRRSFALRVLISCCCN